MKTDPIKEAMLKFAPALTADYKAYVKQTFKNIKADLGPNLKGVYSHPTWSRIFQNILGSLEQVVPPGLRQFRDYPYRISPGKLNRNAKTYGERVALEWYHKMWSKLGMLTDVIVSKPDPMGEIIVTGRHKNNVVEIIQHRILNVSSLGMPFHQFPSRIYVNGRFYSETAYKGLILGWGVREVKREQKPKRPPIDPMSRPRQFYFEYKVDRPARPDAGILKPETGEVRKDNARGMTEEEAWDKIYRRMSKDMIPPYNYYTRIYDHRVVRIYAWNGAPLWKEEK